MHIPIRQKAAYLGILLAFSLILGYLESLIPISFGIPGIKLGLSNLPILLCLCLFDNLDGLILCIVKSVLICCLFGNAASFLYSISGAFLACISMIIFLKIKEIHIPVVSACGAVFHNIGQLFTAGIIIGFRIIPYYLPVLIVSGLIMGLITGFLAFILLKPVKKIIFKGDLS